MSVPFEKFKVFESMANNQQALCQTIFVEVVLEESPTSRARVFIEAAINEKLERERLAQLEKR